MCNSKELNHSIHRQTKTMNVKANHKHCINKDEWQSDFLVRKRQ